MPISTPESFRIQVSDLDLADLRRRIDATRWPDELPGVGWGYGVPVAYLRELATYWRDEYDWRAHEARLNAIPQFLTQIDGQRVHFLHVRSDRTDAVPLMLTHGWPGSIVEFLSLIEPLSQDFHLVIPSMPGFGFSGPTTETGWDVARMARAYAELMAGLGYERYACHGGDWGAVLSRELGRLDSEHVLGVHLTLLLAEPTPDDVLTDDELERVERWRRFGRDLSGYHILQSQRPQTLAYGLTDSPVGQLAWIVEKFREWTDSVDRPEDAVDRDQMLTNVMLYWLTATAGSAARIYRESEATSIWLDPQPSPTPTGVAVSPRELIVPVRRFAERTNNIVHWSEFDRGGHFAAMEQPGVLVDDIRAFLAPLVEPSCSDGRSEIGYSATRASDSA
jgi:microsomal epoxide hydrolase